MPSSSLIDALMGTSNQVINGTSFNPYQQSALNALVPRGGRPNVGAAPAGAAVDPGLPPPRQLSPVELLLQDQERRQVGSFAPGYQPPGQPPR
jgi:hypothetical protein